MPESLYGAGIIGGLLAAVRPDRLACDSAQCAGEDAGLWHGARNVVVVAFFAISWLMRRDAPADPSTTAVALSVVAVLLGAVTGWLGGELVDRLGIGVDESANPNAPSSLKGEPIRKRAA